MTKTINQQIADELGVRETQVSAAVELLDGGATVPFIARYRKEITGTLDDTQLRNLEERLRYLRELEERRAAILESIRAQGKLDDALEATIMAADSKARLEDIYLPYKPKRRTKAQIAREAGLEPLADPLFDDPTQDPQATAAAYVDADKGVADVAAALDGARSILVERFAEDADLIGALREQMWTARPAGVEGAVRQGDRRREVLRLLRLRRAVREAAVAPHPGDVPRREGGGARPHVRSGDRRTADRSPERVRAADRHPQRHLRSRPGGRQVARLTRCAGPGVPGSW